MGGGGARATEGRQELGSSTTRGWVRGSCRASRASNERRERRVVGARWRVSSSRLRPVPPGVEQASESSVARVRLVDRGALPLSARGGAGCRIDGRSARPHLDDDAVLPKPVGRWASLQGALLSPTILGHRR